MNIKKRFIITFFLVVAVTAVFEISRASDGNRYTVSYDIFAALSSEQHYINLQIEKILSDKGSIYLAGKHFRDNPWFNDYTEENWEFNNTIFYSGYNHFFRGAGNSSFYLGPVVVYGTSKINIDITETKLAYDDDESRWKIKTFTNFEESVYANGFGIGGNAGYKFNISKTLSADFDLMLYFASESRVRVEMRSEDGKNGYKKYPPEPEFSIPLGGRLMANLGYRF